MTVGDVTIPEGADVIIPMVLIHHMPEYWPKPSKFDPERYIILECCNIIAMLMYTTILNLGLHQKQRLVDHSWLTCHLAGVHATALG